MEKEGVGAEVGKDKEENWLWKGEKWRVLELIQYASHSAAKSWFQSGKEGGYGFTDSGACSVQ